MSLPPPWKWTEIVSANNKKNIATQYKGAIISTNGSFGNGRYRVTSQNTVPNNAYAYIFRGRQYQVIQRLARANSTVPVNTNAEILQTIQKFRNNPALFQNRNGTIKKKSINKPLYLKAVLMLHPNKRGGTTQNFQNFQRLFQR